MESLFSVDKCGMIKINIYIASHHALCVMFVNFSDFYIGSNKLFSQWNNRNCSSCSNICTTYSTHGKRRLEIHFVISDNYGMQQNAFLGHATYFAFSFPHISIYITIALSSLPITFRFIIKNRLKIFLKFKYPCRQVKLQVGYIKLKTVTDSGSAKNI